MSLHTILRTQILSDAGIAALVGTRFYPLQLPIENTTFPALTSQIVSRENFTTIDGLASLCRSRVSVRACSLDYDTAAALCEQVRAFLEGAAGTWSGVAVTVYCANIRIDTIDPETLVYYCLQDYFINHPRLP